MESIRQQKISNTIKKDISDIVSKMLQKSEIVVTVSRVRMTQDLQIAKVYFSVFPSDKAENLLKELKFHKNDIRFSLAKKVKNQLRVVPQILFYIDDSLDYIEGIENALNNPENPIK